MGDKFQAGEFYIHSQFRDVFIQIVKSTGHANDGEFFNIEYWNLSATGNPYKIAKSFNFLIKYDDIPNWRQLSEEELLTPRNVNTLYEF